MNPILRALLLTAVTFAAVGGVLAECFYQRARERARFWAEFGAKAVDHFRAMGKAFGQLSDAADRARDAMEALGIALDELGAES